MTPQSEIDDALRGLGSVEPPAGLERRICLRLQAPRSKISIRMVQALAAGALAASVGFTALLLNPVLRHRLFYHQASGQGAAAPPRLAAPAAPGGFGAASAVHLPVGTVPVQPTPVNQGRGHSRSGRNGSEAGSTKPPAQQ